MTLETQLHERFGFDHFREGQKTVVEHLSQGHSSIAVFPTGSGKSLCYQLTATLLPNLTLVVSPLLALMKDQLDFLTEKGISAASLDSTLSSDEYKQVMQDARTSKLKILMVSVERFKNERFRKFISSVSVSMLVVDEAHCISEWGHNFRPDYLKLPQYRQWLDIPLVLLLTATATKRVKLDMAEKFNVNSTGIFQTGFHRPNLDLSIIPVDNKDKNATLLDLIKNKTHGIGIVYVTLQHSAEKVASTLKNQGINAAAYHAGLNNELRQKIQLDFMANRIDVVVATIAFGMGIDKSNIRFVVHYDLPKSVENYSQEIGRAGRDGQTSQCSVLANLDDIQVVENFVYGDTPEKYGIECVLEDIKNEQEQSLWEMTIYQLSKISNIRQLTLKTLLVQLEIQQVLTPKYTYSAEHKVKCLVDKAQIFRRFKGERQQFIQALFEYIQFKKTWGTVDFDGLFKQYQAPRSRVLTALEWLNEQQLIELKSSGLTEVYSVNQEALASPTLSEDLYQHFRQHETSEIKRIDLLIRFFESKKCLSRGLARYFDDQQSPEQCGHCSVCRGQVATLNHSVDNHDIPQQALLKAAQDFTKRAESAGISPISTELLCRYLAGIQVPVFTQIKARSFGGFGMAEKMRYQSIKNVLEQACAVN